MDGFLDRNTGFLPPSPAGGVASVTTSDPTVVIGGTGTNPTIAIKHRYVVGSWRITNKAAGGSNNMLINADLAYASPRAVTVNKVSYYGSVAAAGSTMLIEISLDGGGSWSTLVSVLVGEVSFTKDPEGTFNLPQTISAATEIRMRSTTDGSWTGTTVDPQVWLEVIET